jgi:uroporphyrinogen III methyltransferase/synthase
MKTLGLSVSALRERRLAVIGPGTEEALREHGLRAEVSPPEFRAEGLVAALARHDIRGVRVLIPRAAVAREVLPDGLRALGAAVDVVSAYRTEPAAPSGHVDEACAAARAGRLDAVTFTSPSTVRQFCLLAGPDAPRLLRGVLVACIGPVTADAARASGLDVGVVAASYTLGGLVDALRRAIGTGAAEHAPIRRNDAHVTYRDGVRHGLS